MFVKIDYFLLSTLLHVSYCEQPV